MSHTSGCNPWIWKKKFAHFSLTCTRCLIQCPTNHYWKAQGFSGINGHILNWLFSYLLGREQAVVLDGKTSSTTPVLSGVPQGSILCLLLFLIYINDSATEQLFPETHINMYADYLLLHREIKCIEDYSKLQQDVNKIASWVDDNKLTLNSINGST